MEPHAAPRRVQFSSCDQCRRARVACDAHRKGDPGMDLDICCTRCRNRDEQCTFQWMREHKKTPASKHRKRPRSSSSSTVHGNTMDASIHAPNTDGVTHRGRPSYPMSNVPRSEYRHSPHVTSPLNTASTPPDTAEVLSLSERQWVRRVYHDSFETIFGSWIGIHGCPFTFEKPGIWGINVSISNLCAQLDTLMNDQPSPRSDADVEADRQIDHSLYRTIQAFAIRWLPLAYRTKYDETSIQETIITLWRRARLDMLRTINQPSYRSVLTLLLYGLTPVPAGISEDEELDGISGQVCIQAALQQVRDLRARQRSLRFNGAKVSPTISLKAFKNIDDSTATASFINAENTVFYAALTFDTSASLTWSARSMLSTGLFGFDHDSAFRLTRTCGKIFRDATKDWHTPDFELTDFKANQIISSGTAWKLLMWKLCSVCKEALIEGYSEEQVNQACLAVTDAIDEWNATYKPLMTECHKRIQYLNQDTRLRWYSLMLHFHLSLLMLVDAVEAMEHHEILGQLASIRAEAENTVLNTIVFGLNNTYTLQLTDSSAEDGDGDAESSTGANVTVSLIAVDPYVHHIVAGVEFLRKTITRDYAAKKLSMETWKSLCGTLQRTLEHLPSSSKSVRAAKEDLQMHQSSG